MIFNQFWLPTWTPRTLNIIGFIMKKPRFFKNPLLANHIDFRSMLMTTCLRFPFQNPSESTKKMIARCINVLSNFWIEILSILGLIVKGTLKSSWPRFPPKSRGRRASTFAQNDRDRQEAQKSRKWPQKTDGVPLRASFEANMCGLGTICYGFWIIFGPRFWNT